MRCRVLATRFFGGSVRGISLRTFRIDSTASSLARNGAGDAPNVCPPFPFEDAEESKSMSTARPSSSLNLNMSASRRFGRHYRRTTSDVFLPIRNPARGSTNRRPQRLSLPLLNVQLQPPTLLLNETPICSPQLPASGRQSAQPPRAAGT